MENKINFGKILFGVFIFLAIFGLVQLLKDNSGAKEQALNQNLTTSPADGTWPETWVKWDSIFEGEAVRKYGPNYSEVDFVIVLPTKLVEALPGGSSCVGDQESATCLVGDNDEIKRVFGEWSNF